MRRLREAALTTLVAVLLAYGVRCSAAPVGWWWLLVPVLAIALAFAERSGPKRSAGPAFRRGWLFGTAFILIDLSWVVAPAAKHLGVVIYAAAAAISSIEALTVAVAAWLFARTTSRPLGFCLGVPALYALLETARASGTLGLPLAALGTSQTAGPLAVTLALGSVPLATFAALALAALVVYTIRGARAGTLGGTELATLAVVTGTGLLGLVGADIVWRGGLEGRAATPLARVGIVEAGTIGLGRPFADTARDYADATQRLPKDVDYVLWPEGILFLTEADAAAQQASAVAAAGSFGKTILVGSTHEVGGKLHNDLLAIDRDGTIASLYTKRRLVPFGEYQPFGATTPGRRSYDAGQQGGVPVRLGTQTPFGVLICYEVAFADLTRESANAGGDYLVAVLNDSWFAGTDGPDQLAQMLQARAIESGIAILRADAVPPSGLVDADGTWTGGPLRADGTLVVTVRAGLETPFRRYGLVPAVAVLACLVLAGLRDMLRGSSPGRK